MKCSTTRHPWLSILLSATATWGSVGSSAHGQSTEAPTVQRVVIEVATESPLEAEATSAFSPSSEPPAPPESVHAMPVIAEPSISNKKTVESQKKREAAMAKMKTAYGGVFYANDFSYLDDPYYNGPSFFGDCFKRIGNGRLDIGGESRTRFHDETNIRGLGVTGRDDDFLLTRQRLFADWRVCDDVRFFGEVLYADSTGEFFAPRSIEENHFDAQNLFLDVRMLEGDAGKLVLRGGRQELLYGAQRLLSPLDWGNTRRTFDGFRSLYSKGDIAIDSFYTQPVIVDRNELDNPDENKHLYGIYGTHQDLPLGLTDLYYIGFDNDNRFDATRRTGDFGFHTIGSRLVGKTDGGVLYELEGGVQFGQNSNGGSHDASFFVGGVGKRMDFHFWKPTVWGWYDYASGEDNFNEVSEGDDGFHHLFPLAHKYNGLMDLFGRRNLHDINAQVITPITEKVSFLVWYHYFLLDELTTPYSVVMTPFSSEVGAGQAGDRELGHEVDFLVNINLTPRRNIQLGYSHFSAGDYYDTTPGVPTNNDADFLYAQLQSQY